MSDPEPKARDSAFVDPAPETPDEGEILQWTCHPVRRQPWVSVAVSALIVVIGVLIYEMTESRMFALLGLVIMLMSLAKFYFPTTFKLSDLGVTVKTTTQTLFKEWKLYRSCYPDKKGILLSTFVAPSRLENFRGLYVMFEGNGDEVIAFVRERIKRAHPESDSAMSRERS